MAAKTHKSRRAWIEAALAALAAGGVAAVRVEVLARRLGVTKGSFYWHFRDRDELLAAIIEHWEAEDTHAIIQQVDEHGGGPQERLRTLWKTAAGTAQRLDPEVAIREWGVRDRQVGTAVRRVDDQRMRYVRGLFAELGYENPEAEVRSFLVYSLLIGNYFIRARHGHYGRRRVIEECLAFLGIET